MNFKHSHILFAVILSLVGLASGLPWSGRTEVLDFPQDRPADDAAFEASQTAKLLGVPLQNFPAPQGLTGFDELPTNARTFTFTLRAQPRSGPPPPVYFNERKIVTARAPDGTVYEAYCGRDDPYEITPGHGFVSNFENRRQWYENHLGYGYMPQDVYIDQREAGRITPTLFFRDVGSHTTAPHYLAIDSQGKVHLAVADVNISQDNRLDLYWVIGDPKTGKWNSAWLIDRRGFTSWSQPWSRLVRQSSLGLGLVRCKHQQARARDGGLSRRMVSKWIWSKDARLHRSRKSAGRRRRSTIGTARNSPGQRRRWCLCSFPLSGWEVVATNSLTSESQRSQRCFYRGGWKRRLRHKNGFRYGNGFG